jgi:hypothetical protein
MGQLSNAQQIIQSLPIWDGDPLAPWVSVRAYFAVKTCRKCGGDFYPGKVKGYKGKMIYEAEVSFSARECCGKSCAKKLKNPMHKLEAREKVSATLLSMGHRPPKQGGNGRGMTKVQAAMMGLLGAGWKAEYAEKTLKSNTQGYPHHYKIDIANPAMKIAIELDGMSHCALSRQAQDRKKDALLRSLGWKVLRLSNTLGESMCTTYGSMIIRPILQMAY